MGLKKMENKPNSTRNINQDDFLVFTPILSLFQDTRIVVYRHKELLWVCGGYVRERLNCLPEKIVLIFSNNPSIGGVFSKHLLSVESLETKRPYP